MLRLGYRLKDPLVAVTGSRFRPKFERRSLDS